MAHLFVMRAGPAAPLWLQIGLARYLSKFRVHHDGGRWLACGGGAVFDEPPEINLVPLARSGRRVTTPVGELFASDWWTGSRTARSSATAPPPTRPTRTAPASAPPAARSPPIAATGASSPTSARPATARPAAV